MNDYYSHIPGPSKEQAIREFQYPEWLKPFIMECIETEYAKYGGLGSQTGWNVSVKPSIVKKIERREKTHRLLRKLFYHFQVYGVFLKLYKDVYYKPNGYYMYHIQLNYKNIFK